MNMKLGMKAIVYKVVEKVFTDKYTGKDVPYWQAVIEQNGDIESISISESCKDKIEPFKEHQLICEYNTSAQKPKVKIVDVVSAK